MRKSKLAGHIGHALSVTQHNNDADKWVDYWLWCTDCNQLVLIQEQQNY